MSKRLKQSGASFRKSKKNKDLAAPAVKDVHVARFQNFFWRLALLYLRILNITVNRPVSELVAPSTDIEHVESPLQPLQLPSLDISSTVPTKFSSPAVSNVS